MAMFDAILVPAQTRSTKIAALGATTASAEQAMGKNTIFAIVADGTCNIRFGPAGSVPAPDATDFLVPTGAILTFDVGAQWTSFKIYNPTGGAINAYVMILSKFN